MISPAITPAGLEIVKDVAAVEVELVVTEPRCAICPKVINELSRRNNEVVIVTREETILLSDISDFKILDSISGMRGFDISQTELTVGCFFRNIINPFLPPTILLTPNPKPAAISQRTPGIGAT
jgi:hypothetical protein